MVGVRGVRPGMRVINKNLPPGCYVYSVDDDSRVVNGTLSYGRFTVALPVVNRNIPNTVVSPWSGASSGTVNITVGPGSGWSVGMDVSGAGVSPGTKIQAITFPSTISTIFLSQPASVSAGTTLTASGQGFTGDTTRIFTEAKYLYYALTDIAPAAGKISLVGASAVQLSAPIPLDGPLAFLPDSPADLYSVGIANGAISRILITIT